MVGSRVRIVNARFASIIQSMKKPSKAHRRDFLLGRSALSAAQQKADEVLGTPEPTSPAEAGKVAARHYLLEFSHRAMACDFQVLLPPDAQPEGPEWALEALDYLEELEDRWSVYRDHSLMSLVNRNACERPVPVDEELFTLLSLGKQLYERTEGAFDMTSGPLTKAWGFYRQEGRMPEEEELQKALEKVGTPWVELDASNQTVRYSRPGIDINLGGIGKGYAIDLCVDRLGWNGLRDYLFHGGLSSVVARGNRHPRPESEDQAEEPPQPSGWTVGVLHPIWPGKRLLEVQLHHQALGTSGTSRQHFYHQGKRYGHIFDPRTGMPAGGVYSSTVIAPTAVEADALATALYVMGPEKAAQFCDKNPEIGLIMISPGRTRQDINLQTFNLPDEKWVRLMD